MEQLIKQAIEDKKKPVVFIDKETFKPISSYPELMMISRQAKRLGVKVIEDNQDEFLRRTHKLYVIRYGYIDSTVSSMVTRKGGIIIPGK